MYKIDSNLVARDRLLPGIHGLRGIAALAVVFYHLVHIGGVKPPAVFEFIARDFGYSVHLFFILSAFSLMHSTSGTLSRPDWLVRYFTKRFFRIAPLFYALIVVMFCSQYVGVGRITTSLNTLLMSLSFSFGVMPLAGIVWGDWSISVEMIFYAFFPVLLIGIRNHRAALWFLVFSILVSTVTRTALHLQYEATIPAPTSDLSYFSFTPNLAFFALGIYAFFVAQQIGENSRWLLKIIVAATIVILVSLMIFGLGKYVYTDGRADILMWGAGLAGLCVWQCIAPSAAVANRVFEFLGERSFSIYLVHPLIIVFAKSHITRAFELSQPTLGAYAFFAAAVVTMIGVLAAAEVTYRLVEVPGIALGKRVVKRSTNSNSGAASEAVVP